VKVLVDMNLTPEWIPFLQAGGVEAVHGASVGDFGAKDEVLMRWAAEQGYVVFTNDLDFGALLATGGTDGPSVIQVRALDLVPESIGDAVLGVLRAHADVLASGALVTLDNARTRIRVLPIRRGSREPA